MKIVLRRFLISALIGAMVALAPTVSLAEDDDIGIVAKAVDLTVLRPLGAIRLVVGLTALIPAAVLYTLLRLPFNSDTSVFAEAAEILVVEPANFVFRRPLGDEFEGG